MGAPYGVLHLILLVVDILTVVYFIAMFELLTHESDDLLIVVPHVLLVRLSRLRGVSQL